MAKILVTGGSGFIGSHLCDILSSNGHIVINLDIKCPESNSDEIDFYSCDILDLDKVTNIIRNVDPDYVYHLAAKADVFGRSLHDYDVNIKGTENVLIACSKVENLKHLIVTSTQLVVRPGITPMTDDHYAPFDDFYSQSKVKTEQITRSFEIGCRYTIVRPTNIWGPRHPRFPSELWKFIKKRTYLHPSGEIIRSYGYVENVACQFARIIEVDPTSVDRRTFYLGDAPICSTTFLNKFSEKLTGNSIRIVPQIGLFLLGELGSFLKKFNLSMPFYRERYRSMTTDYVVNMAPTFSTLGMGPVALDEAVDRTISWLDSYWGGNCNDKSDKLTIVLGTFPPPMGGAAKNTEIIANDLSRSAKVLKLNTSVGKFAHNRDAIYHLRRLGRTLHIGVKLLATYKFKSKKLYIVPDGGLGIYYTLFYLVIGRIMKCDLFLHHRTFQYINNSCVAMKVITSRLFPKLTHVFLSKNMLNKFFFLYPSSGKAHVCSNARYVSPFSDLSRAPKSSIVLGHLSNLCEEKGLFEVFSTFERLENYDVSLLVGGNPVNNNIALAIDAFKLKWGDRVNFLGHIDGTQKENFFRATDIFLFPTKFKQEAQPNVIFEAMSHGAVCVSWGRGCVPDMYDSFCGLVVDTDTEYVEPAVQYISRLCSEPSLLLQAQMNSHDQIKKMKAEADIQYSELIEALS